MLMQAKWLAAGGLVLLGLGGLTANAQAQPIGMPPRPNPVPMLVRPAPVPVPQPLPTPGIIQPAWKQPGMMPGQDWWRTYPWSPYNYYNPYNYYSPYYNPWIYPQPYPYYPGVPGAMPGNIGGIGQSLGR